MIALRVWQRTEELLRRAAKVVETSPETPLFAAELRVQADELAALTKPPALPKEGEEEELAECIAAYEEERRLAEAGECTNTWGCKDPDHRGSCGFSSARAAALTPTEGSGS